MPRCSFKRLLTLCLLLGMTVLLIGRPAMVEAQVTVGTSIPYQGQLNDGGTPANGAYDFQFKLFDNASAGTQVGGDVNQEDVAVANGLFAVALDFGDSAFNGNPRYLAIGVRPGASTGAYTALSPRRPLLAVPYAQYSNATQGLNTDADGNLNLQPSNVNGNVVIKGNAPAVLMLQTQEGLDHTVELVNQPGGRFSVIVAGGFEALSATRDGRVGIGTFTPGAALEVNGNLMTSASSSANGNISVAGLVSVAGSTLSTDAGGSLNLRPSNSDGYIYLKDGNSEAGIRFYGGGSNTIQSIHPDGVSTLPLILQPGGGTLHVGEAVPTDLFVHGEAFKSSAGTAWIFSSDERIKKNVTTFSDGLDVLMDINPVRYQYNGLGGYSDDGKQYVGVLAQEVEQVAPYMISTVATADFADQRVYDGNALTYILVNAVQEQQTQIDTLVEENTALRSQLEELAQVQNEVEELKALVEQLTQQ